MTDLQKLQDELAALQLEQGITRLASDLAEADFMARLAGTPLNLFFQAMEETKDAARVSKAAFDNRRKEISEELSAHFAEHPEDKGVVKAFGFDNRKSFDYQDWEVISALVTNHMWWLLQPKKKEFEAFLAANSVQDKTTKAWETPIVIMGWLGNASVENRIQAKISNDKLEVSEETE